MATVADLLDNACPNCTELQQLTKRGCKNAVVGASATALVCPAQLCAAVDMRTNQDMVSVYGKQQQNEKQELYLIFK